MEKRPLRLYNLLFPVWMLVWFPSWLWLFLIPGNYLLDTLVLRRSLRDREDGAIFCRRHAWKVCLGGFLADFAGSAALFGIYAATKGGFNYALAYDPFRHPGALLATALAVGLAGVLIFLLDRRILRKAGLDARTAGKAALSLAVITAPYLFLFPSGLLYR